MNRRRSSAAERSNRTSDRCSHARKRTPRARFTAPSNQPTHTRNCARRVSQNEQVRLDILGTLCIFFFPLPFAIRRIFSLSAPSKCFMHAHTHVYNSLIFTSSLPTLTTPFLSVYRLAYIHTTRTHMLHSKIRYRYTCMDPCTSARATLYAHAGAGALIVCRGTY